MNVEQTKLFLQALAVPAQSIKVMGNGWVMCACPLAPWLHHKHKDSTPSFGIRAVDGEVSNFNCFTCISGSAETLLQTIEMYASRDGLLGKYNTNVARSLLDGEASVMPLPEYEEHPQASKVFEEWPSYWLDSFLPLGHAPDAVTYLIDRGVSYATMKAHDLRFDTKKSMIVCPYHDVYGRFAGARGRSIDPDVEGRFKHHDYTFQGVNNAGLTWYNEQVLELPGPVVTVEGQFDTWRTEIRWPKVVGGLTAKPTDVKFKKLCSAPMIVTLMDPDDTGVQAEAMYKKYGAHYGVPVRCIHLPQSEGGKVDPGECHADYLYDQIIAAIG